MSLQDDVDASHSPLRPSSSCSSICTLVPDDESLSDVDAEVEASGRGDKPESALSKDSVSSTGATNDEPLDREAARRDALDFLASRHICLPTTYAEATNLAAYFPQHASAILSLPIRSPRPSKSRTPSSNETGVARPVKRTDSIPRTHPSVGRDAGQVSRSASAHSSDKPNWALAPDEPENSQSKSPTRGRAVSRKDDKPNALVRGRGREERRSKDARIPSMPAPLSRTPERGLSMKPEPILPLQVTKWLQSLPMEQDNFSIENAASSTLDCVEPVVQVRVRVPTEELILSAPAFAKITTKSIHGGLQLASAGPASKALPQQSLEAHPHQQGSQSGHDVCPGKAPGAHYPAASDAAVSQRHHGHHHPESQRSQVETQRVKTASASARTSSSSSHRPSSLILNPQVHFHPHTGAFGNTTRRDPLPPLFSAPSLASSLCGPSPESPTTPTKPLTMSSMSRSDMRCDLPELMRRMMADEEGAPVPPPPKGRGTASARASDQGSGWVSREIVFGEGRSPRSPVGRAREERGSYGTCSRPTSEQGRGRPAAQAGGASPLGRHQVVPEDYFDPRFAVPHPEQGARRVHHGQAGSKQQSPAPAIRYRVPLRRDSSPATQQLYMHHPPSPLHSQIPRPRQPAGSPSNGPQLLPNNTAYNHDLNRHLYSPSRPSPAASSVHSPIYTTNQRSHSSPSSTPPPQVKDENIRRNAYNQIPQAQSHYHTQSHQSYTQKERHRAPGNQLSLDEIMNLLPHEGLTHPVLYEYVKAQVEAGLDPPPWFDPKVCAGIRAREAQAQDKLAEAGEKPAHGDGEKVSKDVGLAQFLPDGPPRDGVFVQAKEDGWMSFGHGRQQYIFYTSVLLLWISFMKWPSWLAGYRSNFTRTMVAATAGYHEIYEYIVTATDDVNDMMWSQRQRRKSVNPQRRCQRPDIITGPRTYNVYEGRTEHENNAVWTKVA
ncbi:hypothetical protein GLOTRDRAFT_90807 [Gloeophyllum trabeum ATCC 11539]|uniref:Uncharacterized protein n=1 Tax=Gloeophyllum trabeum (strain ATCC 11539 / FP-39264 / Madison 617) TaxID=670483 RepID=S7QIK5_GLOTA|nr:uncharacterized protein GLOTRDRAFT_90807 [Gloeophyllum trabeum ATCC 11539]EPQ59118.1 hypothetical protein GLOTRDRAFT_90807 [Gloeophyllum trabeum ATCC 11539]